MAEPQREPAADLPPEHAGGRHAAAEAAAAAAREVFVTTKKRDAVVVNGFVMIKHFVSSNGRIQYWRCILVNKMKCNARVESVAGTTAVVMREKYNTHNHDPDATALKVSSSTSALLR